MLPYDLTCDLSAPQRLWEYWLGEVNDPHASITQEEFIKALQHAINQPAYKTTEKKQMPVWAFFYKVGHCPALISLGRWNDWWS